MNGKFYSTHEAGELLGVTHKTVQRLCESGKIRAIKASNAKQAHWMIPADAIVTCKHCGRVFPTTTKSRVYCSDECALEAKRKSARDYWNRTHPKKEPEQDPECEQLEMDFEPANSLMPFEPVSGVNIDYDALRTAADSLLVAFAEMFDSLSKGMAIVAERLREK